jgi:hypothetical protein
MALAPDRAALLLPYRKLASDRPALRIGVLTTQQAPWVDALVAFLREIPGLEVTVSVEAEATRSERPGWLLERLYEKSRARFDPFGPIRGARSDVRVQTPHGFFTVRFGDQNRLIPFWNEVANNAITSVTTIYWNESGSSASRPVRRIESSTIAGLYPTMNSEQPVEGTIRSITELCIDLRDDADGFVAGASSIPAEALPERREAPGNLDAARFIARKLARSALARWNARGKRTQWFLAMRENRGGWAGGADLSGFREIALPAGIEMMADPFLCETAGPSYLLFEEIAAGSEHGRIACLDLANPAEHSVILEREHHLSYPCAIAHGGDLFLMPESAEARRVELHRFQRFPGELELIATPIEGAALVDSTPVFVEGRWYIFTTTCEPFLETILLTSDRLEGPWQWHPANPVSTSVRSCRSAGHLFWREGKLYRPTQDCSVRYGYAIVLNEIVTLNAREFEERAVKRVLPDWMPGLLGTHTWNESGETQVIDGLRYA